MTSSGTNPHSHAYAKDILKAGTTGILRIGLIGTDPFGGGSSPFATAGLLLYDRHK